MDFIDICEPASSTTNSADLYPAHWAYLGLRHKAFRGLRVVFIPTQPGYNRLYNPCNGTSARKLKQHEVCNSESKGSAMASSDVWVGLECVSQ